MTSKEYLIKFKETYCDKDPEFRCDECLEKNGPTGTFSESAVDMLSNIALAFAAGELDWIKDIGRDDEE